jgi:hypothetical protein
MTGRIYLLQENGTLQSLTEQPYASEDLLQSLLADYPDLLAGEQMDEAVPRRWLLVSREIGIPDEADVGGRWSLDHLFLDQDGIPTLVEVKRSEDTRIRRQVVGQMLDYAANAVVYWPLETIRATFDAGCENQGQDPALQVLELMGGDSSDEAAVEEFWGQVKTNLQAGRIRMVFVADEIPSELKQIVEFLNAQMNPAEVLAVEISQYLGQGLRTLVPRVIGLTAEAQRTKAGGRRRIRQWDEPKFFRELETSHSAVESQIARDILEWAQPKVTRVWWGKGIRSGSFVPILNHKDTDHQIFAVWTNGSVEIYFQHYKPPFDTAERRRELMDRLNAIPGVSLTDDVLSRRPSIPLATFQDQTALDEFLEVFDWLLNQIRAT